MKKENLETAKSWQSVWAILSSIIVLLLVGIDFFDFLPDIKYIDIGLDCLLSLTGLYFLCCTCILNTVLSKPREKLEKHHVTLFLVVIPCALLVGILDDNIGIGKIILCFFCPWKGPPHWIKEVSLSSDEKLEIMYLLRGLNPDLSHLRVKRFCEELIPNKFSESSSLLHHAHKHKVIKFVELVNKTESDARQSVLKEYFRLGRALVEYLKGNGIQIGEGNENKFPEAIKEIVEKFSSITEVRSSKTKEIVDKFLPKPEEILEHYIPLNTAKKGFTLVEFFDKHLIKTIKGEIPNPEEIEVAHNALKVYSIFSYKTDQTDLFKERIQKIKTFSASSIGQFTRNEILDIFEFIDESKRNPDMSWNNLIRVV